MARCDNGYYTVSEAAARLGVSRISIWRWVRDGHLPAIRPGPRTTRIRCEDLELLLVQAQDGGWPSSTSADASVAGASLDSFSHPAPGSANDTASHGYTVLIYESEAFLLDTMAAFIGPGLREGIAGVVVATQPHRAGIANRLRSAGIDLDAAMAEELYTSLDATELLSPVMVDGVSDGNLFTDRVRRVLDSAARGGRHVRVFAGMASLLTGDSDCAAALDLEALWLDLRRTNRVSLLSAYPIDGLGPGCFAKVLARACSVGAHFIPAESCALLFAVQKRLRASVKRQEEAHRQRQRIQAT